MSLLDRIGYEAGSANLEDALETAATHDFNYLDFNADIGPNRLDNWSDARVHWVRDERSLENMAYKEMPQIAPLYPIRTIPTPVGIASEQASFNRI